MNLFKDIVPVLHALKRHKTTVALFVLEISCTFSIVCNLMPLIINDTHIVNLASGINENHVVLITSTDRTSVKNVAERRQEDVQALRSIPGVDSVVAVQGLPMSQSEANVGIAPGIDMQRRVKASIYFGGRDEAATLGLRFLSGKDFVPSDYQTLDAAHGYSGIVHAKSIILSHALAQKLFPGSGAVGKIVHIGPRGMRVAGVVNNVLRPHLHEAGANYLTAFLPLFPDARRVTYVLKVKPGASATVMHKIVHVLKTKNGDRLVGEPVTFVQFRSKFFGPKKDVLFTLLAASLGLLFVTVLGIVGLVAFWLQQRHRQIGIRRALGASKSEIIRYFQIENMMVTLAAALVGVIIAFALNSMLVRHFNALPLSLTDVVISLGTFVILGQASVFYSSLKASRLSPMAATNSL